MRISLAIITLVLVWPTFPASSGMVSQLDFPFLQASSNVYLPLILRWQPESCENLVPDPSFEAYTPNPFWTEESTNFGTPLCTVADCGDGGGTAGPRTGSVWGWFGGTNSDWENAHLYQTVTFPSSGLGTLQFYFWIGAAEPGSDAGDVFSFTVGDVVMFTASALQAGQYPNYTLISLDVSGFADGQAHQIRFGSLTRDQAVNFNLDDVSLTNCAPLEQPNSGPKAPAGGNSRDADSRRRGSNRHP